MLIAKAIWAFLRGLPWQLWVGLALIAVFLAYGHARYNAGVDDEVARAKARELVLQKRIAKLELQSGQITTRAVTKVEYRTRTIRERGATIIKEVPVYVPDDACPLPAGFRVLHDAAAAGVLPDAARIPFAAPVPAQAAAVTIAGNYAACQETAAAYCGLMEWGRGHGWPVPPEAAKACEFDVPSKQTARVGEP